MDLKSKYCYFCHNWDFDWMRSNLELLPVINVKSRPRYISAQKSRHYFDALNEREIGR
jgi:hypothetical protein